MKIRNLFRDLRRWYLETPDRALDEAYQGALRIKAIEDEHFQGEPVSAAAGPDYCDRVLTYFQSEVKNQIRRINLRLSEFRATGRVVGSGEAGKEQAGIVIDKLNFIDEILKHYQPAPPSEQKKALSLIPVDPKNTAAVPQQPQKNRSPQALPKDKLASAAAKTGAVPRSILNTFSRVKRELDPQSVGSEGEMVKKFRQARDRTAIAVKFLLLLIIVPLLTHQLTKTFIIEPLIEQQFFTTESQIVFLNQDLQEEAFMELEHYEKTLRFTAMLGLGPDLSEPEVETKLKKKADELAKSYRQVGASSVSNVFADLCSLVAFGWVIVISRREIQILKDFIDELVYGLSDSAKAFLIILFTDMFVGFHSPHGWEVILEGVSRHFGLPESRDFNFLFIATFPVILDTVLKYWIFRYLNRISPSAVATYKTMNE